MSTVHLARTNPTSTSQGIGRGQGPGALLIDAILSGHGLEVDQSPSLTAIVTLDPGRIHNLEEDRGVARIQVNATPSIHRGHLPPGQDTIAEETCLRADIEIREAYRGSQP